MYICYSPWLFAACHVLHRLLVPRHSPCALSNLTFTWFFNASAMQSLAWVSVLSYFFRQNPRHIVFEDSLRLALTLSTVRFACANLPALPSFCFSTLLCKTFFFFSLSCFFSSICSFQGAVRFVSPARAVRHLQQSLDCGRSAHSRERGGDKGSRTPDLLLARQALSQLSYAPTFRGTGPEN